ncbi:diadenylate cyclase [Microvirga sp. STR05]|uniref:DNA integrity scanning protein DisA nucleotide-binding domain protein n=1 Tax=Hymenobacter duratus TaxID=2771356 RepID=A0ABR8JEX3_9BACT|nr:diadenylate cyclase [Hymenobacter duratus]MBD2714123.1 DNA integrity scanning protein DisA nucleotide-binding domain protein [Hymenobacter duratus]MBR7949025.1 diadenylate cyclase [Microvirga sp. STR05]
MDRFASPKTKEELLSSLHYIFPITNHKEIDQNTIIPAIEEKNNLGLNGQYAFWSEINNGVVCLIYDNNKPRQPHKALLLTTVQKPEQLDLNFANYFCKVFNDDIKTLPLSEKHSELWISLRQTQFRRAISKFSSFSTEPIIQWMQIVENSVSLRYENKPFSLCLFMTKQREWIQTPLGSRFIPFKKSIPFAKGIMAEKWLRAAMSSHNIGIAGVGFAGDLFGLFDIPYEESESDELFSPHEDLTSISKLLVKGTCLFITTENGDIYLQLANKSTFYKTQGRWHYLNYNNIYKMLKQFLNEEMSRSILKICLNLSYEKQGALILIPDVLATITEIIPDINQKNKANGDLRDSIKGLKITDKIQRRIITTSAKIDGALVISRTGTVQDVACMIGQPSPEKLAELKIEKLERYSGARTTAAWNASTYGISIKVSEDGPIMIFRHGMLITQIG